MPTPAITNATLSDIVLTPVANTEELASTASLAQYNLAVNTRIQGFICLGCGVALNLDSIARHFRKHSDITFGKTAYAFVEQVAHTADLPSDYMYIIPAETPVPSVDGIGIRTVSGCPKCPYTANHRAVQQHIRQDHNDLVSAPLDNIDAQVLNNGRNNTLFRVTRKNIDPPEDLPLCVQQFITSLRAITSPSGVIPNARLVSPWLHRSKFPLLLVGREPADLCAIVRPLDVNELEGLKDTIFGYFEAATDLIDKTDELVLQYLNTADPDKEGINNRPFSRHHQHETTLPQYLRPIVRFLAGLLRAPHGNFQFPSSPQLDEALLFFSNNITNQDALHRVLLALWKCTWPTVEGMAFSDPTICFLALFTLHPGGNFSLPVDVTPVIAKLVRAILLTMLTKLHSILRSDSTKKAIDVIKDLGPYIHEKHYCPFNSLRSLQHYASTLAFNTIGFPRIVWIDTKRYTALLYEGQKLTMDNIHDVFVHLEQACIRLWEEDILLGESIDLKYDVIADRLRHSNPGYSFLDDPQNTFHKRFSDLGKLLIEKHFTIYIAGTGATQLNYIKVWQWLLRLSELEGLLALSCEMKGGAPACGTELTSMKIRNSPYRIRNVMAHGRYVAIVGQYAKTTNISQSDRLIPHALDTVTADLLILRGKDRLWVWYIPLDGIAK